MAAGRGLVRDEATGLWLVPSDPVVYRYSVVLWRGWEVRWQAWQRQAMATGSVQSPPAQRSEWDGVIPVLAELRAEPDNSYNPEAILVAPPRAGVGAAPLAPVGYMREDYLWRFAPPLHELMDAAGGPIACHAWIPCTGYRLDEDSLSATAELSQQGYVQDRCDPAQWWLPDDKPFLALPDVDRLPRIVAGFKTEHRLEGDLALDIPGQVMERSWRTYTAEAAYDGPLDVRRTSAFGRQRITLTDPSGVTVGAIEEGVITLLDERRRGEALVAGSAAGLDTRRPQWGVLSSTGFADVTLRLDQGYWWIHQILPDRPVSDLPIIGRLSASSGELEYWHRPVVNPLIQTINRHGLTLRNTRWIPMPHDVKVWNQAASTYNSAGAAVDRPFFVLPAHRGLVPEEHAQWLSITWQPGPAVDNYRHGSACRLCGAPMVLVGGATVDLCQRCSGFVYGGRLTDLGTDGPWDASIVFAIARIQQLEGLRPPTPADIGREPGATRSLVESLLLRALVPRARAQGALARPQRPARTWAQHLAMADTQGTYRPGIYGVSITAADGHTCRSLFEKQIDDFFHAHRIEHTIEPPYPWHDELNPHGMRADWRLPDGTFVEALELQQKASYAAKTRRKIRLAEQTDIRLVLIEPSDLPRLGQIFDDFLN